MVIPDAGAVPLGVGSAVHDAESASPVFAAGITDLALVAQGACVGAAEPVIGSGAGVESAAPTEDAEPSDSGETVDAEEPVSGQPAAQRRQASAAPKYTPSASELTAAQDAVDAATLRYQQLQLEVTASDLERRIVAYELEAALQRQSDLEAGDPGAFHRELEIKGATVYLEAAREAYQQTLADPTATAEDRIAAAAAVTEWQDRLHRLQS
ncbi:hypothetical protein [Actinoplanes sp. HUAS TT8]|uniref:hypothetical protein n=1 Tax=Actinoplanes sp. HUAS TT8 TaxID=3447453 RepID=UPI003F5201EC